MIGVSSQIWRLSRLRGARTQGAERSALFVVSGLK